ncbi:hypothetical protein [uncultured Nostoc sp.]|uniref:hypothetical protein n=1 Tax=uncultured Nostoc sp. TaxID=340711 RepID=UPI0035CBD9D9
MIFRFQVLTSESDITHQNTAFILCWYTYCWQIEEYYQILKWAAKQKAIAWWVRDVFDNRFFDSDCRATIKNDLFVSTKLLRMTYLPRNY